MTIGLDLGDKYGQYYTLDEGGENIDAGRVTMLPGALEKRFGGMERSRIVMESGTHSAWVSRLLEGLGHEVIVANARKLRLISENENKDDAVDAELLARVGRVDPKLLYPIQHRGAEVQADLAVVRAREALVKARGQLINHLRGAVKSVGGRLPKCSTASFHRRVEVEIPAELEVALRPLLELIEEMSGQIRVYEEEVERLCRQKYPETELLRQVGGGAVDEFVLCADARGSASICAKPVGGKLSGTEAGERPIGAARPGVADYQDGQSTAEAVTGAECATDFGAVWCGL
jgi:transposase